MNRTKILANFHLQYGQLVNYLKHYSSIRIGTLGPVGTTSYFATQYFIKNMKQFKDMSIEIVLKNNFTLVHEDLLKGNIDIAVIPNAYEQITQMYWDTKLKNLFSFLLETPYYGLAAKPQSKKIDLNGKIKISTCTPVICLVEQFVNELGNNKLIEYEIIKAESTINAANMVNEGIADYAVTNETSIKEEGLEFISSNFKAEVLWTVFTQKKG